MNLVDEAMIELRKGRGLQRKHADALIGLIKSAPKTMERLKAKCQWEHMTWLGVLREWSVFVDEARAEIAAADALKGGGG